MRSMYRSVSITLFCISEDFRDAAFSRRLAYRLKQFLAKKNKIQRLIDCLRFCSGAQYAFYTPDLALIQVVVLSLHRCLHPLDVDENIRILFYFVRILE